MIPKTAMRPPWVRSSRLFEKVSTVLITSSWPANMDRTLCSRYCRNPNPLAMPKGHGHHRDDGHEGKEAEGRCPQGAPVPGKPLDRRHQQAVEKISLLHDLFFSGPWVSVPCVRQLFLVLHPLGPCWISEVYYDKIKIYFTTPLERKPTDPGKFPTSSLQGIFDRGGRLWYWARTISATHYDVVVHARKPLHSVAF